MAHGCLIFPIFDIKPNVLQRGDCTVARYNSLLDGCAQSSLVDDGLRVLREMEVRLGSNGGQTWKSHELRFFLP